MGYYILDNGKYRVSVSIKGRGRRTSVLALGKTEQDAKDTEDKLKKELQDGVPSNKSKANRQVDLVTAFTDCLNNPQRKWMKDGSLTEHGKKQTYYANSFYKHFGKNKLLREIKLKDWHDYIRPYGETNTNNRRACCMNSIFKNAYDMGDLTVDNLLKIPRNSEKLSRVETFSRDEEVAIIKKCEELGYLDLKDFFISLIDIGARPEELRTATIKDLQETPDGKMILVLRRNKTGGNDSMIGLRKRTQEILVRRSNQKRFFLSSYRVLYSRWNDVRDRLNKTTDDKWTFYTCRHTCASRLAQMGKTLVQIAEWLGHSRNSPVTRRYVHFFPKDVIQTAEDMDKFEEKLSANKVRLLHKAN